MAKQTFRLNTFIRQPPIDKVQDAYCRLGPKQPLLLEREPGNPASASAVRVTDLFGDFVGYLANEHSGTVSERIANGQLLLARTNGHCQCIFRRILIWADGQTEVEADEKVGRKRGVKIREPERA